MALASTANADFTLEEVFVTATASATQVREGIYHSSVQRWRCYEHQLEPVRRQLEEAGIDPEQWG